MKIKPTSTRGQFEVGFVGTAWCIADDKFLVTAHHVFNDGKSRNPGHRYYVFAVPGNGATVFMFPVINFPLEDQANDMAIVEIGSPLHGAYTLPSVPVTFTRPVDGEAVLTYGFPAPQVAAANIAPVGTLIGTQTALFGHANEGIVAAQHDISGAWAYEFNVRRRRVVRFDPATAVALRGWKASQAAERLAFGPAWRTDGALGLEAGWIVTEPNGAVISPETLLGRWRTAVRAAGVGDIPIHGARHSYAELSLAAGVRLDVVSRQLGHASITTTAVYLHDSDDVGAEAAGLVGGLLDGPVHGMGVDRE